MSDFDALLEKAGKLGFIWHMFRADAHGPEILVGVFRHSRCADVFVLSGAEHAHAYRLPTDANTDVFAPKRVYWWYGASPVWTLRALLTLAKPREPCVSGMLTSAPTGFGIPGGRVPVQVRHWLGR